jgi:hypothetical protein
MFQTQRPKTRGAALPGPALALMKGLLLLRAFPGAGDHLRTSVLKLTAADSGTPKAPVV